ncbi:MAG: hypothetical protein L0154_29105 [Chloroflexi bacterium]|nr:hypothetical protein [Chloroflexota bacterium]
MLNKRLLLLMVILLTFTLALSACGDPEIHNERTHAEEGVEEHTEEEGEEAEAEATEGETAEETPTAEGE